MPPGKSWSLHFPRLGSSRLSAAQSQPFPRVAYSAYKLGFTMPNSQALPLEVKPATHNYFRITIQWQKKNHLSLGLKCSGLVLLGLVEHGAPASFGKKQGLLWSPVQLEPAMCACLKFFFLGRDAGFFFFGFFLFILLFLFPDTTSDPVLHSLLSWHLPRKSDTE